jgi:hypothetical protein
MSRIPRECGQSATMREQGYQRTLIGDRRASRFEPQSQAAAVFLGLDLLTLIKTELKSAKTVLLVGHSLIAAPSPSRTLSCRRHRYRTCARMSACRHR